MKWEKMGEIARQSIFRIQKREQVREKKTNRKIQRNSMHILEWKCCDCMMWQMCKFSIKCEKNANTGKNAQTLRARNILLISSDILNEVLHQPPWRDGTIRTARDTLATLVRIQFNVLVYLKCILTRSTPFIKQFFSLKLTIFVRKLEKRNFQFTNIDWVCVCVLGKNIN